MKAISPAIVLVSLFSLSSPADADLALVARYDWIDGARDVSGSPVPHDGVLDDGVMAEGGTLEVFDCSGVAIGPIAQLDGASRVLLRFEDIDYTDLPAGATGQYSALAGGWGDGKQWWVGIDIELPPYGNRTALRFNLGGWQSGGVGDVREVGVVVAEEVITHFESIEYLFDGSAAPEERIAFRWNDGPWSTAGWPEAELFSAFPGAVDLRFNFGCQADWDHLDATLGPISIYAETGSAGGLQRPGDGTGDGSLDLSDAVFLLGHLFLGEHPVLPCGGGRPDDPGNIALLDSNGDAAVDLSDAVHDLTFLFLGGSPPVLGAACVPIGTCPDSCR